MVIVFFSRCTIGGKTWNWQTRNKHKHYRQEVLITWTDLKTHSNRLTQTHFFFQKLVQPRQQKNQNKTLFTLMMRTRWIYLNVCLFPSSKTKKNHHFSKTIHSHCFQVSNLNHHLKKNWGKQKKKANWGEENIFEKVKTKPFNIFVLIQQNDRSTFYY